jgi:hypothetical protein
VSTSRIALIVGGHGEKQAVPILLRRIAERTDPGMRVDIVCTFRESEDKLRKPEQLERFVDLAARKLGDNGGLFILLDCDWPDACARRDAPALLERAHAIRPRLPIALVLACMEYEAWFIAAIKSLHGKHGLADDGERVQDPEEIRGAKGWLSRHMLKGNPYSETIHQPSFTRLFDMDGARRATSFDKCYRSIEWLLPRAAAPE